MQYEDLLNSLESHCLMDSRRVQLQTSIDRDILAGLHGTGSPMVFCPPYINPKYITNVELVGSRRSAAHGEYCATLLMIIAQLYHHDKYGNLGDMEPLNTSVELLELLPQGRFETALKTLSRGKGTSMIEFRPQSLGLY